jgi:hypothetical protein
MLVSFFMSFDRYEVHNTARSDLFLILGMFSYFIFLKFTFAVKELLPCGGFFVDFDLAGLKMHPGACTYGRISISPVHFLFQTAVSCPGCQLISIPPMHFVLQTEAEFS